MATLILILHKKDLIKIGIEVLSIRLTTIYTYDRDDIYGPINFPRNLLTGADATVTLAGLIKNAPQAYIKWQFKL